MSVPVHARLSTCSYHFVVSKSWDRMLHGEECLAEIHATIANLFTSQGGASTAGTADSAVHTSD